MVALNPLRSLGLNRFSRSIAMTTGMFILVIMLLLVWCDALVLTGR
jgi:hypothetical protein